MNKDVDGASGFMHKENMLRLGSWIRTKREAAGLSQMQLAIKVECSPSQISEYENGHASPSMARLRALCVALGASADDALGIVRPRK